MSKDQETTQALEMSPTILSDPVSVVLEKLFNIAKEWDKTWIEDNRKYSFGFGFVKGVGFYLLVKDKLSGEQVGFHSQGTGLNPSELSRLMKHYGLRLKQLQPAMDFAAKKQGRKLKGRVPKQLKRTRK